MMRFDAEEDLEVMLLERWWGLRRADAIELCKASVLGMHSYRPFNVRDFSGGMVPLAVVRRQFRIPGAGKGGGTGKADLVEFQLRENPRSGALAVNACVVELKRDVVTTGALTQLLRYITRLAELLSPHFTTVSVGGAAIGTSATENACDLAASLQRLLPIDVGVVHASEETGVRVRSAADDYVSNLYTPSEADSASVLRSMNSRWRDGATRVNRWQRHGLKGGHEPTRLIVRHPREMRD